MADNFKYENEDDEFDNMLSSVPRKQSLLKKKQEPAAKPGNDSKNESETGKPVSDDSASRKNGEKKQGKSSGTKAASASDRSNSSGAKGAKKKMPKKSDVLAAHLHDIIEAVNEEEVDFGKQYSVKVDEKTMAILKAIKNSHEVSVNRLASFLLRSVLMLHKEQIKEDMIQHEKEMKSKLFG
jgi:hypothetical protein